MACKNCGRKNPFHTCFSGGDANGIHYNETDRQRAFEQIILNEARGAKGDARFKGVPKAIASEFKFKGGRDAEQELDKARRGFKGKK